LHFDTIPPEWEKNGLVAPLSILIEEVDRTSLKHAVKLDTALPVGVPDGTFDLSVWDPTDTSKLVEVSQTPNVEVTRMDPGGSPISARTNHARWLFNDLTTAVNRLRSMRSEAQSLSDAADMDEDYFTGSSTEVFD